MNKHAFWWLSTFAFATPSLTMAQEKVYYCVIDQVVGLQTNKQSSGNIKIGDKGRFRLSYKPPAIAINGPDPLYTSPTINANIMGRQKASDFSYVDRLSAFASYTGLQSLSEVPLLTFEQNKESAREKLNQAISAARQRPLGGSYVESIGFFGADQIYLLHKGAAALHGIYSTTGMLDPSAESNAPQGRIMYGYMYYFSCEDF